MPVNPTAEYKVAEQEYGKARTIEEKIKALEKMYSLAPKHKGAENLLMQLKQKLSKLKEQLEKTAKKGKGNNRELRGKVQQELF